MAGTLMDDFLDAALTAQVSETQRPFVQEYARAITESTPPLTQRETQGGLPYPYPGKNPSGEM
jgi:hypothetical protein